MKWISTVAVVVGLGLGALAGDDKERSFRFKKEDVGKVPSGWKAEKTGKGEGSVWKVIADEAAPSKTGYVLAQTAEGPNPLFNVCVANDTSYKNVAISVAFKAVKGEIDQGGGLVWRYKDNNNYYIVRMNPLEDNFRVYKIVDGKRTQLQSAEANAPAGEWHRIKVEHNGDHIECYFDQKKLLDVKDSNFKDAGKIGLWSKADAQTYFDDLKVETR